MIGVPPLYDIRVHDSFPYAEIHPDFLKKRGNYKALQERCNYGEGIKVGIGDTGVDSVHLQKDLAGVREAKDFTNSRSGPSDRHGHGSHVTGHIWAREDDHGMMGVAPRCEQYHAKVLGDSGSGSYAGIAKGIEWMVAQGCQIINLSLGGSFSQYVEDACREAVEQGVIVMAALGNSGTAGAGHPGTSRYTFGIAAVDYNKRIAGFSSRSEMAKYSGYGVDILSCITGGRYATMSGTSMATPDQVGILALYLSWRAKNNLPPITTMEQLEAAYVDGLEDLGPQGHDVGYGLGFLHLDRITQSPPPPQEPAYGVILHDSDLLVVGPGEEEVTFTKNGKTYRTNGLLM